MSWMVACLFFMACEEIVVDPTTAKADLVFFNGNIYTEDGRMPKAAAMAVRAGRVMELGSNAQVAQRVAPGTRIVDLGQAFVMPGLIEGHGHFLGLGQSLLNLPLAEASSWEELVAQVAAAAKRARPGDWIVGRGWHQEKWREKPRPEMEGFPIHSSLSASTPDNPVILTHASGHGVFANAKAMELAGIRRDTPNPPGGRILRGPDGEATGYFNENAADLILKAREISERGQSKAAHEAQLRRAWEEATKLCLSKGITSFQDAGTDSKTIEFVKDMNAKGQLGLRLWFMLSDDDSTIRAAWPRLKERDPRGMFRVGGIKRFADGALGSRGAWLLEPYSDLPDQAGKVLTPFASLEESARLAKELGLQLCVHAIGDRANREVLDLYEKVLGGEPRRWRIEHAQHLHPEDIPRFARLNLIASIQSVHCTSDAGFVPKRLGEWRSSSGAYVWRSLLKSGARLANGTDAPVEAVDPLPNLYAAVSRKPAGAAAFFPEQRMSRAEALYSLTLGNAYAAYMEDEIGSLEVGKWADFVVFSKDLSEVPEDEILAAKVLQTWIAGKEVYRAENIAPVNY